MSEAVQPVKKVSREGIVLIKSFEGFRPRAVARPEGGWIIGYGHTLSAREGATVSEADAELLLRYDLLAIEKRLNATGSATLNQHQFDALASFALSVGLARFESSDVLSRLTSGDEGAAAEAMLAWPETRSPSVGARRRAAERALFTADPSRPVALADLLAAPVAEPTNSTVDDVSPAVALQDASQSEALVTRDTEERPAEERFDPSATPHVAPRVAAVAALLGEDDTTLVGPAAAPIVPRFETPAVPVPAETQDAQPTAADADAPTELQSPANDVEPEVGETTNVVEPEAPETPSIGSSMAEASRSFSSGPVGEGPTSTLALNRQRYSPYGAQIVGPLPLPAQVEQDPETDATENLILTSPDDAPAPVVMRPAWTAEERAEVETAPAGESLFGEDLSLTQGGAPLGAANFDPEPPQRFDWSEAGAFIVMGAVGLTAFGASMAAFRLASEQGGGDETSIIGWVLAVIGVACVGVSSFNLYRKFGLAGSDR